MNRLRAPHSRRDAAVELFLLLLPLLLAAIVLTLSALFSSPASRHPAVVVKLLP